MNHARDVATAAALLGAAYATGLLLGQWLFNRSVLYPR